MSKQSISSQTIKILWGKSGGICAICKQNIILEKEKGNDYLIGEMAHIEGENPGSPRYNSEMTDDERKGYENLIILCPNHHTMIDNDEQKYTASKLKEIKREHEIWHNESCKAGMTEVTFTELEKIIIFLTSQAVLGEEDYENIITPKEKIKKNNLSSEVDKLITMGLLQVKQIKDYLTKIEDIDFSEKLRAGFVGKYKELSKKGLKNDALFYALWEFASNNSRDFRIKAAGLSILTYFFELCEVFEK